MSLAGGMNDLTSVIKRILGEGEPMAPFEQREVVSDHTASLSTNCRTMGPNPFCGSLEEELRNQEFLDHAEDEDAD
jgi:hypothetical protein